MLSVDLGELQVVMSDLLRNENHFEDALTGLERQVDAVLTKWEGRASEGFQGTYRNWRSVAEDLRARLGDLRAFVLNAHDNHDAAIDANLKIWRI
jgi:WXG100 family type VII secretion target